MYNIDPILKSQNSTSLVDLLRARKKKNQET